MPFPLLCCISFLRDAIFDEEIMWIIEHTNKWLVGGIYEDVSR